jgi:POT family proton-dependent oligopeptide transporter
MKDPRDRFPSQIRYLAWNEGCERFSFYGMSSILTIYMARHLGLPESDAEGNFHLFVFAAYVMPLVGAYIADRFLGRYAVILWLSLGYVFGHATMAAFESEAGLWAGLLLVAIGAGGIKPCAAAFVGDQFDAPRRHLLEKVYDLYYWVINLGSTAATLAIPELLDRFGPRVAFALPGVLMAGALVIFWAGRRTYVTLPPSGPSPHGFFRVVGRALRRLGTGRAGEHWLEGARDRHPPESIEGAKAVLRVSAVFATIATFWSLFFQYGSSWVLQAERMERRVLGYEIKASQMSTLDPLLVLAAIPILAGWIYPVLERRGARVTALRKMTAGMFVTVFSFVAAGIVQWALDGGARPHVAWQVPQYVFLAVGEVLVSVTALEFAYTQAPPSMKSTVMSLWYLTIAAGSLLGYAYFAFFAALMLCGAIAFALIARRVRPVDWVRSAERPAA